MVTKTENIIYDTNYTSIINDGGFVDNKFVPEKTWFFDALFWNVNKILYSNYIRKYFLCKKVDRFFDIYSWIKLFLFILYLTYWFCDYKKSPLLNEDYFDISTYLLTRSHCSLSQIMIRIISFFWFIHHFYSITNRSNSICNSIYFTLYFILIH